MHSERLKRFASYSVDIDITDLPRDVNLSELLDVFDYAPARAKWLVARMHLPNTRALLARDAAWVRGGG